MLSFRANDGTPVAIIKGGEDNNRIIYIRPRDPHAEENPRDFREYAIADEGMLQPLPLFNGTSRLYIAGSTMCGKSYFCRKYLEQYIKVFPKKKIFVFSDVEHDETLDSISKNIVRFKLDDGLLNGEPIKPETFKDSVCIFDDIDSIQNPKLLKYIQSLRDAILRRGRHENITCLCTSHLLTNYKDTRIILNEANSITIFPGGTGSHGIKYLLSKYCGMDKAQIARIMALPSRWVSIYTHSPSYVSYEKGIYTL